MKEFIRRRWVVEGCYRFDNKTSSWKYECAYRVGAIWEFGEHALTCFVDGKIDYAAPYAVTEGDVLTINFSGLPPHPDIYFEMYKAMRRGGELWLYDRKVITPGESWRAMKLVPAE